MLDIYIWWVRVINYWDLQGMPKSKATLVHLCFIVLIVLFSNESGDIEYQSF